MGQDYIFPNGDSLRSSPLMDLLFSLLGYKDIVFPLHPNAEYCNIEGEEYRAKDSLRVC